MGFNNERARIGGSLVVDIETYALDDAGGYIEPVSAPANYKDPEKIAAYVAERQTELLERCALDPDLCRVVAIGGLYHDSQDAAEWVHVMPTETEERFRLEEFWRDFAAFSPLVGFNILGFDLPVLVRRSQYLGIPAPAINMDRYRTAHIDLMERLSFNGKLKYRSLDFYCRRFGIPAEDATNGNDIAAMVKAEDWDGVATHCLSDIRKTAALAKRIGVLHTEPVGVL